MVATCYDIVKQYGGHLEVDSECGRGTAIEVYLPRTQEPAPPPEPNPSKEIPQGWETVLIAEDEPLVRDLLGRTLRGQGYDVLEATDGVEALDIVEKSVDTGIHLLLSDIEMPRMQRFGESYRAYLERTAGLLHRRLLARLPRLLPASGSGRIAAILALYAASIVLAVAVGDRVRGFSLSQLSSLYSERMAVISPAPLTQEELRAALRVASGDAAVKERLDDAGPTARLLVYVVPRDWEIADLPMELDKKVWGHQTPAGFDRRHYRVLFTKVRTHHPAAVGVEILARAYGRDAMMLVNVDLETEQVGSRQLAAQHNLRWGDIPTPLF